MNKNGWKFTLGAGLAAVLLVSTSTVADDRKSMEETFKSELRGQTLRLRTAVCGEAIEFDADGKRTSSNTAGSWTDCGELKIKKVALKDSVLKLKAQRFGITFGGNLELKPVALDDVEIRISFREANPEAIEKRLDDIFFRNHEPRWIGVPRYWQCLLKEGNSALNMFSCRSYRNPDGSKLADAPFPIGSGLTPPKPLLDPDPEYTEAARKLKHNGKVVLAVTIDANGNPKDIDIIRPLGLGLDDRAAETVSTWKFNPATKYGKPMPSRVAIEVSFQMW